MFFMYLSRGFVVVGFDLFTISVYAFLNLACLRFISGFLLV